MLEPSSRFFSAGAGSRLALSMLFAAVLAALVGGAQRPIAAASFELTTLPAAHAAGPGRLVKAPDLGSEAELVRFAGELLPTLLQLRLDQKVRIADWPVAPGARKDVLIARHDVYAPGARILQVDAAGTRELPRSRLVFFWGIEADEPLSGIFVSVDPVTGTVESLTQSSGIQYELRPLEPGKPGLHLLATAEAFQARATAGHKISWTCGNDSLEPLAAPPQPTDRNAAPRDSQAVTNGTGYDLGTVAIDTDHELLANKFNNDTTAATNYIASMFATINVMYERDLQVELQISSLNLRTSAASDPYTQGPSSFGTADANELAEFTNYWFANYGNVTRTVAAMLSGKSPNAYEASGIATVGGLCETSSGYSFNQLFTFAADSSSLPGDTLILGHEIGHNFGTRHTHCYSPPIDECYNGELGCYSGPTSCPAPSTVNGVPNVLGTIMSYCHLLSGCSSAQVFHPRVVAVIAPNLQNALGVCITPQNTGPAVISISPNNGSTAGGTAVTIAGSNFQSGATVTIGGIAATGVNVVNANTITAVTGAHATGTVDVVVTSGGTPVTLAGSFFYASPSSATRFYTVAPCRVIDTRNPNGPYGGPALGGGQRRTFQVTGQCGIPSSAVAVSVNVTAIGSTGFAYFSLYPGNAFPLGTSTLGFGAGQTLASATILELATDGSGTFGVVYAGAGSAQFLLDVNGYFQ